MYLAGKTFADNLTSDNSNILTKDRLISVRPRNVKTKRIILSNVCPIISHNVILDAFKQMGIRIVSPISFIRVGFTETEFKHILSFRRQVYIHPDDVNKLPESLQVNYDETSYWIFISTDNLTCFQCKREGHLAKHCPNSTNESQQQINSSSLSTQLRDTNNEESLPPLITERQLSLNEEYKGTTRSKISNKRPLSTSSNSSSQLTGLTTMEKIVTTITMDASIPSNREVSSFVVPIRLTIIPLKKQKKEGSKADQTDHKTIDLALKPVKHFFKYPDIYIIKFEQYKELLTKAKGNPDIVQLAQSYTNDLTSLIKMLRETYPSLSNRSIKNRISRIINKLELHGNWTKEEDYGEGFISSQDPESDTDFSI